MGGYKVISSIFLSLALLFLSSTSSPTTNAATFSKSNNAQKARKKHATTARLTRAEVKEAEQLLADKGYKRNDNSARSAFMLFQKWQGRKVTGRLTADEFEAIKNADPLQPKDTGYRHVEVDLDRQLFLLIDEEGSVKKILPVSTGSNRRYHEKGMRGLAYTPRGRFRIYSKLSGWRKSPLGLLYYPNYFSDGLAIHGNPSVPDTPQSHGCIRIPMSAAGYVSRQLPVGTIVLIYDNQSFVSAKDWAEADKQKREAAVR